MSDGIESKVYPVERYGISLSNVPKSEALGLLPNLRALESGTYEPEKGVYRTGAALLQAIIGCLQEIEVRE